MFSKSRARTLGCLFALGALVATLATACDPAPTITNVQSNPSTTTAYIYWETNAASSSQVFYGPTSSYGTAAPIDTNGTTTHLYLLTGLTPATTYHYKVQSKTTTSDVGESGDYTFTTGTLAVSTCDPSKGYTDELCWWNATGVANTLTADPNDTWKQKQIMLNLSDGNGHTPSQQGALNTRIGSQASPSIVRLTSSTTYNSGSGTTGDPWVWENRWVFGCVSINVSNVIVRNVLIQGAQTQGSACADPNGGGGGTAISAYGRTNVRVQNVEVDGSGNSINQPCSGGGNCDAGYGECAAPPWDQSLCPDYETPQDLLGMNIVLQSGSYTVDRVNGHGGMVVGTGWTQQTRIIDSYFHDPGHMHQPCWDGASSPGCNDYHKDTIWAQWGEDWSVTHTFGTWSGRGDPDSDHSSGGILCDRTTSRFAMVNIFNDGSTGTGGNVDVACGIDPSLHTKVVMDHVYIPGPGGAIQNQSSAFADHVPNAVWTPSYASNGYPNISQSYCTGIYKVTTAGVASKVSC